jgi:glutamate/tyrosine decarboxylase-like PLP-dependent enzyme
MNQSPKFFPVDEDLVHSIELWSRNRIINGPDPKNGARTASELEGDLGASITTGGIGGAEAFRRFTDVIVPAIRANDGAYNLAYVPAAPSAASVSIDLALSAAEIFAGAWEAGAGAIHAENQALQWLAELAGFPKGAGGTFVSGGTVGNLSALFTAREKAVRERGGKPADWKLAISENAHSSNHLAARVLGVDTVSIPVDERGRITLETLNMALDSETQVFAVLATAGSTNAGMIDDLEAIADYCDAEGVWMHVDGAYGIAGIVSPDTRPQFKGLERAHSFIVDPHKWLFAPYDSCALVYSDPAQAQAANTQTAPYLELVDREVWNPSDFAIHLSRRARGLPLWFSLATYGTDRYAKAVEQVIATTHAVANGIKERDFLDLLFEPDLSVLLFRRVGWNLEKMTAWSERHRIAGTILCIPTFWNSEPVYRLCFVNPETKAEVVLEMLDTLQD